MPTSSGSSLVLWSVFSQSVTGQILSIPVKGIMKSFQMCFIRRNMTIISFLRLSSLKEHAEFPWVPIVLNDFKITVRALLYQVHCGTTFFDTVYVVILNICFENEIVSGVRFFLKRWCHQYVSVEFSHQYAQECQPPISFYYPVNFRSI